MGGLPKLQSIKTMHVSIAESDGGAPPNPIDVYIAFPDRMHIDIQTQQGALTIVSTPDAAFMSMAGMGTRSMPPEQKNEMLAQMHHDLVYVAQHADDPAFTFTAAGTEKIGDVDAAILDIGGAIPWVRWYIDPKTGYILREKYKAMGQSGSFEGETNLADWRTVDGLTMPYKHREQAERQRNQQRRIQEDRTQPHSRSQAFRQARGGSSRKTVANRRIQTCRCWRSVMPLSL
jgi:hypothetical protein